MVFAAAVLGDQNVKCLFYDQGKNLMGLIF